MFLYFVIEYDLLMFKFYPNVIHLEDVNTFIWNGWPVDMNKYHEWGIDIDVFNPCVKYSWILNEKIIDETSLSS